MNFRLNDLTNRDSEFDKLLKKTKTYHNMIMSMSGFDGDITVGRVGENWRVEIEKWHLQQQRRILKEGDLFISSQDVSDYIDLLNTVNRILKDKEAPEDLKATLEDIYTGEIHILVLFNDNQYIQELFNRRNEIDKETPLRKRFVTQYIEWEIYSRFYQQKNDEIEARGGNPEDYDDNSPEGLKKANEEWEKHRIMLFKEHDEEDLLNWKDDRAYRSKLPEDWKEQDRKRIDKVISTLSEKDRKEIEEVEEGGKL